MTVLTYFFVCCWCLFVCFCTFFTYYFAFFFVYLFWTFEIQHRKFHTQTWTIVDRVFVLLVTITICNLSSQGPRTMQRFKFVLLSVFKPYLGLSWGLFLFTYSVHFNRYAFYLFIYFFYYYYFFFFFFFFLIFYSLSAKLLGGRNI